MFEESKGESKGEGVGEWQEEVGTAAHKRRGSTGGVLGNGLDKGVMEGGAPVKHTGHAPARVRRHSLV